MTPKNRSIFSGMQILVGHEWQKHHAVVVEEGKIKAIIADDMIKHHLPAEHYEYKHHCFLVPGLIDLHIHGTKGNDVMDGSVEAIQTISRDLASEGVTGFLATTMTASAEQLEKVLQTIPVAMSYQDGAEILGIHLEGPFIAKEKMGAQCGELILAPDVDLIQKWQTLASDTIKLVTLAPELPGALELIAALHKMEVIVSVGHTNATYEETTAAITAGCTHATHLFNAMRGLHQREPGALGALLLADQVHAELIADGHHLHPAIIELALRVKNKNRLLLVTDGMRAKCLGNGKYDLGGQEGTC